MTDNIIASTVVGTSILKTYEALFEPIDNRIRFLLTQPRTKVAVRG